MVSQKYHSRVLDESRHVEGLCLHRSLSAEISQKDHSLVLDESRHVEGLYLHRSLSIEIWYLRKIIPLF